MNSRAFPFSLVLILALSAAAIGQTNARPSPDAPWQLVFFPFGDPRATEVINEAIRDGYVPVGLEITQGESLGVLLVRTDSVVVRSWAILDYDDWNALETEITGGIADGFVPMDISRYGETLAILWVRADLTIEAWRVSTSPNTIADRTRTINNFQGQGFTLWGMSVHEGLVWYLFLRQPGVPPAGAVSGFSKDGQILQAGMVNASKEGWLPNGLASTDRTIYICFVR